jgi:hypothetical protein
VDLGRENRQLQSAKPEFLKIKEAGIETEKRSDLFLLRSISNLINA